MSFKDNSECSDLSENYENTSIVTHTRRLSPVKMPSTSNESETDSLSDKIIKGKKR